MFTRGASECFMMDVPIARATAVYDMAACVADNFNVGIKHSRRE